MDQKYKIHLLKAPCVKVTNLPQVELTFKEFDEILSDPINTGESVSEYESLKREGKALMAKDKGGYIAGELKDNKRGNDYVINRCMITIDIDGKDNGVTSSKQIADILKSIQSQYIVHSTRSYRKDDPHVRIVIPLSRPVSGDEFERVTKALCSQLGIGYDSHSTTPAQLMFLPTRSKDQPFYHKSEIQDRDPLNVDELLSTVGRKEQSSSKKVQAAKAIDPNFKDLEVKPYTGKLDSFEFVKYVHMNSTIFENAFMDCGLLERVMHGQKLGFVCNECGNGSGKSGTGVVIDKSDTEQYHYKCFKCGKYEDLFKYIEYPSNIAQQKLNVKVDYVRDELTKHFGKDMLAPLNEAEYQFIKNTDKIQRIARPVSNIPDMIDALSGKIHLSAIERFVEDAKANVRRNQTSKDLLNFLGINSDEVGLVDPNCFIPGSDENFDKNYLVIPTSKAGCVFVDPSHFDEFALDTKMLKNAVNTPAGLFLRRDVDNETGKALNDHPQQAIILTNRTIDMLAFYQAGAPCVISVSNNPIDEIACLLQTLDSTKPIVLAYNNDDESNSRQDRDSKYLNDHGFEVRTVKGNKLNDLYLGRSSAIEALVADSDRFSKRVEVAYSTFEKEFEQEYMASNIDSLFNQLEQNKNIPYLKTGFSRKLDSQSMLDGGLFGGNVYFLGGITGCGKSTIAIQMADYLACSGIDVIYYALEMSQSEIMARCISRRTWLNEPAYALTEREILDFKRHSNFSPQKYQSMIEAKEDLKQTAGKHLIVKPKKNLDRISVKEIRQDIEHFRKYRPNSPLVVFVDYLQILSQPKEIKHSMTDKQIVDINTITLKQMAEDFGIPIFLLSSFNRESYNKPLSLSNYKESGSIEYTGSTIMGMDMYFRYILGDSDSLSANKATQKDDDEFYDFRTIRLKILKNRQGQSEEETYFAYKPAYNCFIEIDDPWMTKNNDREIQRYMDPKVETKTTNDPVNQQVDQTATKRVIDIYNLINESGKRNDAEFPKVEKAILKAHGVKNYSDLEGLAIDEVFYELKKAIDDEAAQVKLTQ